MDDRDRLIISLAAQLRAERETREAFATAIRNGSVSMDVLEAILTDPVPVITREDIIGVQRWLSKHSH
ncbi:hypothetical protein [Peteryoungia ipomoeae]|uniref:Uncharacterized protein n=1 Tax=Peteryoungia ipomoeae TaxID=1210932 RepID=A0A4S8P4J0_9HYPH|nr:hypothetical protein [Peteryoungia ipomoeae]THV23752.1 hypothetical protein FAA97_07115 [Peteryoungia ipomoeae]